MTKKPELCPMCRGTSWIVVPAGANEEEIGYEQCPRCKEVSAGLLEEVAFSRTLQEWLSQCGYEGGPELMNRAEDGQFVRLLARSFKAGWDARAAVIAAQE